MFSGFDISINFQPIIDVVYKMGNALWSKIGSVTTQLQGEISTAKSEAISAAAADATTKANAAQSLAQTFASGLVNGVVNGESEYSSLDVVGNKLRSLDSANTQAASDLDAVRDIALNGGSGLVVMNLTGLVWADLVPKLDKDGENVLGQTTYRFVEQSDDQEILLSENLSAYSQLTPYLDGANKLTVGHGDDLMITWGGTIASPVITDVKYYKSKSHELLKAGLNEVINRIDASVDANVQAAADAITAALDPALVALMGN